MVGTDNVVSVQSVKTAECFPSEEGTISSKILNLGFFFVISFRQRRKFSFFAACHVIKY